MQWISNVSNDTYNTSQFRLVTFQVLNCHMCLVATGLDSIALQAFESSEINDMHSLQVLFYKSCFFHLYFK